MEEKEKEEEAGLHIKSNNPNLEGGEKKHFFDIFINSVCHS